MDLRISALGPADLGAMRSLIALFADAFEAPERADCAPSDAWLVQGLAQPHIIVRVAYAGETLAGGLVAYSLHKLEQEAPEIYLYDLAVAEAFRRRGVATALLKVLQAESLARGAASLFVQADGDDAAAIALYARHGSGERVHHFDLQVAKALTSRHGAGGQETGGGAA